MGNWTQGKWVAAEDDCAFVYALNEDGINRMWFTVHGGFVSGMERTRDEEIAATATLLKAAPALYAALDKLVGCIMETRGPDAHVALEAARAALASATDSKAGQS